jgi:hypothetical protein
VRYCFFYFQLPSFALALCVRKFQEAKPSVREEIKLLDLSCVDEVICGAEPISHKALVEFNRVFAPLGWRSTVVRPCYGLAENSVFGLAGSTITLHVDKDSLENKEVVVLKEHGVSEPCEYISNALCLPALGNLKFYKNFCDSTNEYAIVDPVTLEEVAPNKVSVLCCYLTVLTTATTF